MFYKKKVISSILESKYLLTCLQAVNISGSRSKKQDKIMRLEGWKTFISSSISIGTLFLFLKQQPSFLRYLTQCIFASFLQMVLFHS